MKKSTQRHIEVWADWLELKQATLMGHLYVTPSRGKEIFSFEYDRSWLKSPYAQIIDPALQLYRGQQYAPTEQENFGVFLDSAPDRWGRLLMDRREVQLAREEKRDARKLRESDYLLGVYDGHRMGGLRFRLEPGGPFIDDKKELASPPWTSLRELEQASLALERDGAEKDPNYSKWLRLLIAPGGSLGGARPKASVVDNQENLWIAKFPSRHDDIDISAWEKVVHQLAAQAGVITAEATIKKFGGRHHTFLTKRFDRTNKGKRLHFASAMTLLQHKDGDDAETGANYLEMATFITQQGAHPKQDLEQLWRRIVFFICVSNVDDHLRNHGFMLTPKGWNLAPAYDINPSPTGDGLKLNISESDNSQDLELAKEVAEFFQLKLASADKIIAEVTRAVKRWQIEADELDVPTAQKERMATAFRVAGAYQRP